MTPAYQCCVDVANAAAYNASSVGDLRACDSIAVSRAVRPRREVSLNLVRHSARLLRIHPEVNT
jgi:hypothetical protein